MSRITIFGEEIGQSRVPMARNKRFSMDPSVQFLSNASRNGFDSTQNINRKSSTGPAFAR